MSWKKGKSHALKLRALADAWAKEAEEELLLEAGDVEHVVNAMRDALHRRFRQPRVASA